MTICSNSYSFFYKQIYKGDKQQENMYYKLLYKIIRSMACSKYEYVKNFQQHRTALPQTYMVIRIDGRGFTKFCTAHKFVKPNDIRAINLMNQAALYVCDKFKDIFLAYGQSDQYSFALTKNSQLFNRRIDKIQTCIVSSFSSAYVYNWTKFFPETQLKQIPSFDARIVQYPNLQIVKDYFKWRQVDCHINNLYNTVFWCMMKKGMKNTQVQNKLKDTNSGQKNQILYQQFGINYNSIQEVYRRGSVICYKYIQPTMIPKQDKNNTKKVSPKIAKQLKSSIRQLKQATTNTDKVLNKLITSQVQQDKQTAKQLQILRKQLQTIKIKYQQIDTKVHANNKITMKQKNAKIELVVCSDDMIKDQFWENIKLQ